MTLVERAKEHWLIVLIVSWVTVGTVVWTISEAIRVGPRAFEIERLRNQVGEIPTDVTIGFGGRLNVVDEKYSLVVLDARIGEGETVIASDGTLAIKPESIAEEYVAFSGVLLPTDTPISIGRLYVGNAIEISRQTFLEAGFEYEIRLVEIKDSKAHFIVRRVVGQSAKGKGKESDMTGDNDPTLDPKNND